MLYKTLSAAVYGIDASIIEVEVDVSGIKMTEDHFCPAPARANAARRPPDYAFCTGSCGPIGRPTRGGRPDRGVAPAAAARSDITRLRRAVAIESGQRARPM